MPSPGQTGACRRPRVPGRVAGAPLCLLVAALGFLSSRSSSFTSVWGSRPIWTSRAGQQAYSQAARVATAAEGGAIFKEVHKLAQSKAGRALRKGEVEYTFFPMQAKNTTKWMAQLTLDCFEGSPSCMGEMKPTRKEAKQSAAETFMSESRFQSLMEMGKLKSKTEEKPEAAAPNETKVEASKKKDQRPSRGGKKEVPKVGTAQAEVAEPPADQKKLKKPVADLALGAIFTGRVVRNTNRGVLLAARGDYTGLAWLSYTEAYMGVARAPLKRGSEVTARILAKTETETGLLISATRREGPLVRPAVDTVDDPSSLGKFVEGEWYEGEVLALFLKAVLFKVKAPGGSGWSKGLCKMDDFRQAFDKRVNVGQRERLRVKQVNVTAGHMLVSMIDKAEEAARAAAILAAREAAETVGQAKPVEPLEWPPKSKDDPMTRVLIGS